MKFDDNSLPALGWTQLYQSQLTLLETETHNPVRITCVHGNAVDVLGVTGSANILMTAGLTEHGVAVGDWLLIDDQTGIPTRVLERKSLLQRRASGDAPSAQLIAANVDTLFIVTSCNADYNPARLERYLVLARQGQVDPVVILTKADGVDDPDVWRARALRDLPGVAVETVNATDAATADLLGPYMGKAQTLALVGSSGVGKTTLVNLLTGGDNLTLDIRESDAKGRHTTTARSMYRLPSGAWMIDTPGMRALRLTEASDGVAAVFHDLAELATRCRFNDCGHDSEPGCAIQAAIAEGKLEAARLKRWLKLLHEDLRNTETVAQTQDRRRQSSRKQREGRANLKAKRGDFT